MCKFCRQDLSSRMRCGILAIATITISVAIIAYMSTRDYFGLYNKIFLGAACFALLAAICLLIGAIMENRFLVWTWVVIMLAVIVTVTTVLIIRLCRSWEFLGDKGKAYNTIALIIGPC
ncbi:hypothetical protein KR084_005774, partial [Drosophila pseudotakahashii]